METRTLPAVPTGPGRQSEKRSLCIDKGMRLLLKRQLPVGYEGQTGLTWQAVGIRQRQWGALGGGTVSVTLWETAPEGN